MKSKKKSKVIKSKKKTVKSSEPKPVEQRWTEGYSTFDGQGCRAWFNVTNWP